MDRVMGVFQRDIDWNVFSSARLKQNELTPAVMAHLGRVFSALAVGLVVAGIGVLVHLETGLGGMATGLGALGVMLWMAAGDPRDTGTRTAQFALYVQAICVASQHGSAAQINLSCHHGWLLQILLFAGHVTGRVGGSNLAVGSNRPHHCVGWHHRRVHVLHVGDHVRCVQRTPRRTTEA